NRRRSVWPRDLAFYAIATATRLMCVNTNVNSAQPSTSADPSTSAPHKQEENGPSPCHSRRLAYYNVGPPCIRYRGPLHIDSRLRFNQLSASSAKRQPRVAGATSRRSCQTRWAQRSSRRELLAARRDSIRRYGTTIWRCATETKPQPSTGLYIEEPVPDVISGRPHIFIRPT
ncbi:unnamed protein product, partial [Trichogramma brassicae]